MHHAPCYGFATRCWGIIVYLSSPFHKPGSSQAGNEVHHLRHNTVRWFSAKVMGDSVVLNAQH